MPEYIIAYHGGKEPENPDEGARLMAKWQVWMGGLGDAMVNPGTPPRNGLNGQECVLYLATKWKYQAK